MRRSFCRWIHSYRAVKLTTKPMPPPAVARHAFGVLINDIHASVMPPAEVGEAVSWAVGVVFVVFVGAVVAPGGNLVSDKGAFIV